MKVKENMYIDAVDPTLSSDARYINSSGGGYNNARISPFHHGGNSSMNIVATRDIPPGTEVFMPYGSAFRMVRAQPPAPTATVPAATTWRDGMTSPAKQQTDGRTRWRINPEVDWSLFQQHIQPSLVTWMHAHRHAMHYVHIPPPPVTRLEGSLHACAYTDGASRGNPGTASCGGVIFLAKDKPGPAVPATAAPIYSFGKSLGVVTNNYAEYQGVIEVLEAAQQMGITHIKLYVDSQLVCRQIQGIYQVKDSKLMPQHARATTLVSRMESCTLHHVMREHNKDADAMCNRVLDMLEQQRDPLTLASLQPPIVDHYHSVCDGKDDHGLTAEQQQEIKERNATLRALAATEEQIEQEQPAEYTQAQIDTCWQQLHSIITHSAQSCLGSVDVQPNSKHWWALAPNIHALHATYTRQRRAIRRARRSTSMTPAEKAASEQQYREARIAFLTAVKDAKQKEWDEVAAAVDSATPQHKHRLVWAKYKRSKPSTRVAAASFPNADGAPPRTAEQALSNMATHIAAVSSLPRTAWCDVEHEAVVHAYVRDHIPVTPRIPLPPSFSLEQVEKACLHFRLNTALGSDNISPYCLRHGGSSLHRAVHMLFSICSWYGVVPTQFRHAHVFTLYKGDGDTTDANNYRPIAITSVLARIYERIHKDELLQAMAMAGIPSPDQFGFTQHRSCHDAVYRLLSHIVETHADKGKHLPEDARYVPAVFIDISKAYDKVWIEGLLYKLHHDLGITGNLFYMIRALLTSRTIQVVCDGKISTLFELMAGVPQGSVLAPLLFLIYIHGLTQGHDTTRVLMSLFADDIAVAALRCGVRGVSVLSPVMRSLSEYARKWKITFSAKKTNVVYFKPGFPARGRGKQADHHVPGKLKLGGFNVDAAKLYTYLGIILDQYLTMKPHMLSLIARARTTAGMISRLVRRDHAPSIPVIQTLVKCVLVPQMTYGFGFIPPALFKDEPIYMHDTGGAAASNTGTIQIPTNVNLHQRLNSVMILALRNSMGMPHSVHHDSFRIEARILSLPNLASLECARLAHRWASNTLDATNPAAALFRAHAVLTTPLPPTHPFNTIAQHIGNVDMFTAITDAPDTIIVDDTDGSAPRSMNVMRRWLCNLRHTDRHKLRQMVWAQQWAEFKAIPRNPRAGKNMYKHPLHHLLERRAEPPTLRHMPHYMHVDTPAAAVIRARLRLGRARLLVDQNRTGYKHPSVLCRMCNSGAEETVRHVLQDCTNTHAVRFRTRVQQRIVDMCTKHNIPPDGATAKALRFSSQLVLKPYVTTPYEHLSRRLHMVTGRYIIRLRHVWNY